LYAGAARLLLQLDGKFTIGKMKSSRTINLNTNNKAMGKCKM